MSRVLLLFKLVSQLGIRPLLLYAVYRLGILTGHYRRLDARMRADAGSAGAFHPVFALPERSALVLGLDRLARTAISREADAVIHGKVRLFGDQLVPLQLSISQPLRHWTDYERDPSLLAPLAIPNGDVKYLWEPARFGWAYSLGSMFFLTGRETYALAFWKRFEQFESANPAYSGPHWMNGQEVAIRLMALLWAAHTFVAARASTASRRSCLSDSIALHAARIPPTLIYARSQNNNHLVTEAAALYLAGTALDRKPWRDLGWQWLNRALQSQINSYGEYIQHSSNYHRLMLQSVLQVEAVRRQSGFRWPARTQDALARASHWLFSMLDPASGGVPNLGANDGALVLPLSACPFEDFRPTVQAAARAFLHTSLPPGDWDDLSLWLGLPPTQHTADSGAYAAEHLRARNSWAHLRASQTKSRLSHMDQLHLDLWWRGLNVVPDAGTYLYNAPPPWDNPLVSSRVHNCITVDGREQMTRGGRFLVLDWFPAYVQHVLSAGSPVQQQIRGAHRGFAPLGLAYERTLSLMESGVWQIEDDLVFTRRGTHTLGLHWLLIDGDWKLQEQGSEVKLRLRLPRGWMTATIRARGGIHSPMRTCLVRAGKVLHGESSPPAWEGWISPTYGRKLPALSFSVEAEAFADCRFTTEFQLPN
ncbi:MAG TPA: heparinase II/III family protein [Anaerolineales bacterium]|nr:heparinase II/III family protein [Anaerolineales bacterium]